jgi:hypothetical protein
MHEKTQQQRQGKQSQQGIEQKYEYLTDHKSVIRFLLRNLRAWVILYSILSCPAEFVAHLA